MSPTKFHLSLAFHIFKRKFKTSQPIKGINQIFLIGPGNLSDWTNEVNSEFSHVGLSNVT